MKKLLVALFAITLLLTPSYVKAEEGDQIDNISDRLIIRGEPKNSIINAFVGDPVDQVDFHGVSVRLDGERIPGTTTYPNYDSSQSGTREFQWVFTPNDTTIEPVTGTVRVNFIIPEPETPDEPTAPSLTATTVKLENRTVYDINLNNKVSGSKYRWTSSNPDVAKVNAKNGLVTAVSEGEALITCEITLPDDEVLTLTSTVNIGYDENAPELTETILDLEVGDKFDINLENKIAKSRYRWISSDRGIVRVNSANGKVTAVGAGEAYVTCTITTPENQVIVLRCDISVTE